MNYELLDSGSGQKLERFNQYTLIRPCQQAIWRLQKPELWSAADASFSRENGNKWTFKKNLPKEWISTIGEVQFKISPTDFGHLGVFPEHADLWQWMRQLINPGDRILNLFAYSGGVTLAAAQEGAHVCHLDASKGMVDWARENAKINQLEKAPVRWIVDDALKFLKRESKREVLYEGIILDPPTFGRGAKGEIFKIEEEILPLLQLCKEVLSAFPKFIAFSCHTPGFTPIVMEHLMRQMMPNGQITTGEMTLHSPNALSIPSGSFARWTHV
jgi:23S rRNA (cytosine1962-C5)-methyltransferase